MKVFITVKGLVQGIGYRPFVAELAEKMNISGWVRNTFGIVTVLAKADNKSIEEFVNALKNNHPMAQVTDIDVKEISHEDVDQKYNSREYEIIDDNAFLIVESNSENELDAFPFIPADLPTCDSCKKELMDKTNRRYRHPFISCTKCGPRYSIIKELPYDRVNITMADFEMCDSCRAEYTMKGNIRRHAQTIACHNCGPKLKINIIGEDNKVIIGNIEPLEKCIEIIREGGIVAVKDIGGYHLVCRTDLYETVNALRMMKKRQDKPFAIMYKDIDVVKMDCQVNDIEKNELESPKRPIVLLYKNNLKDKNEENGYSIIEGKNEENGHVTHGYESSFITSNVINDSTYIGAMLPGNPVQIMLSEEFDRLIMTSANISGDLMITDNQQMLDWMIACGKELETELQNKANVKLAVLSHDREILTPLDDSIVQITKGRRQLVRRARGMVPEAIDVNFDNKILAFGGDLKSTFCFTSNGKAIISQNFGDLDEFSVSKEFLKEIQRMGMLLNCKDKESENIDGQYKVVCDRHPAYVSVELAKKHTKELTQNHAREYTREHNNISLPVQIFHHHAHVASVIAEHKLTGDVIGVAFDGTGYGEDKTIWGGEFFRFFGVRNSIRTIENAEKTKNDIETDSNIEIEKNIEIERIGHLNAVKILGQDAGAKNTLNTCYGFIKACGLEERLSKEIIEQHFPWMKKSDSTMVCKAIEHNVNTVMTSSMGRLFDAVSAMLGICTYNAYEGQAPTKLQYMAENTDKAYPLSIDIVKDNGVYIGDTTKLFRDIFDCIIENKAKVEEVANGFIDAVVNYISDMVKYYCIDNNMQNVQIALSGGTFLNRPLTSKCIELLESQGCKVFVNEKVPPTDAGLCLGQAYLAKHCR